MYSASDLRKGLKIEVDGQPWEITEFDFCKPGKGTALYRCKLKNVITGNTMDRTYRPTDKVGKPDLSQREVIFSYKDGEMLVFSDVDTFEELHIPETVLGERRHFLLENAECTILFYNDQPVEVDIPIFIEKVIIYTEPGVRGDTATNVTKPATLDNGHEIQVPLFVNQGDQVKIDTRTGQYVERINKKRI